MAAKGMSAAVKTQQGATNRLKELEEKVAKSEGESAKKIQDLKVWTCVNMDLS